MSAISHWWHQTRFPKTTTMKTASHLSAAALRWAAVRYTMAGRKNITAAGMFTQYVRTLNEPRGTGKMVLNANTSMLAAISVIRVALRGPLEWLLCLDAFHQTGRLMYAVLSFLFFPNSNLWKCNYWSAASFCLLSGCRELLHSPSLTPEWHSQYIVWNIQQIILQCCGALQGVDKIMSIH